ncbi:MAG: BolA family transcriptional regulator [Acidiferrobacteraceae bacterium]|jgi:BolA protein|nr:BolA family transcriptional regulator [Acidiferrobacteraceae bacterium]
MNRVADITERLRTAFSTETIEIEDQSHLHAGHAGAAGGGGHYNVTIVSERFVDLDTLARHRLVYQAVEELMHSDIHALSIRAYTPEEI